MRATVRWLYPLSLLVGFLSGFLIMLSTEREFAFVAETTPPGGAWQVTVTIYPDRAPQIEHVIWKAEARQIAPIQGESVIQLLSESGKVLVEQSFRVSFIAADLPEPLSQITMTFSLPDSPQARFVYVRTPYGKILYELHR